MIPRLVLGQIEEWIGLNKIIIIKGARQVGKTTLLNIIKTNQEKLWPHILYYSCDQELGNPIFSDPKLFVKYIHDRCGNDKSIVILDEFQYISNAGLFLKVVHDLTKEKIQLIASGSSSLEISKNTEYLTGRKVEFYLSTISFKEFALYKLEENIEHYFDNYSEFEDFVKIYAQKLKSLFLEYLSWGGYPEIIITEKIDHKHKIIKEIVSTYLQKDISGFLNIENLDGYNNLIRFLCNQIGNLVNISELSNTLGLNYETIKKYLNILSGTYVFDFIKPFSGNLRKELTKMSKVFVSDLGLRNIVLNKMPQNSYEFFDDTSAIENYVYLALSHIYGHDNINFYRTVSKSEIDFIIKFKDKLIPLEVKFTNKVSKKLFPAMKNFNEEYIKDIFINIICSKDYYNFDKEHNILYLPIYLLEFFKLSCLDKL